MGRDVALVPLAFRTRFSVRASPKRSGSGREKALGAVLLQLGGLGTTLAEGVFWGGRGALCGFGGDGARGRCVLLQDIGRKGIFLAFLSPQGCPGERRGAPGSVPGTSRALAGAADLGGGVGDKVRLGAFVSWGNVYLTSSKATNRYKKLLGKVLTGG